ncbi:CD1107 family mobile element protein [Ruminococcus sp.]|uniref:CD1107 family mobile element protein n=1 Tax=Ruminococcus sp. TaxID=41978 RepID=UPI001B4C90B7|nr:DUF4366 domain-containing protein [Ruminococcus sp.]MBP5432260.1 DUF4366 domain-containing protein [Ruminococcus sp.]
MNKITKLVCSAAALSSIIVLTPFTASAEDVMEVSETTAVVSSENTVLESTLPVSLDNRDTTISVADSADFSKKAETSQATEKSALPLGNGTLLEDVPDENVYRQFLTIQSKNGNTFYIVIDKNNEGKGNVYFMNLVDEYDLMAFADKFPDEDKNGNKKKTEAVTIDIEDETSTEAENEDAVSEDEQTTTANNPTKAASKNLLVPMIGILALICGAAFYFVKFKGTSAKNDKKYDYDEEDDDFDNGETVKDDD